MPPKTYIATVGMNYPTAKGEARVEAGQTVSDMPAKSVSHLLALGYLAEKTPTPPATDEAA